MTTAIKFRYGNQILEEYPYLVSLMSGVKSLKPGATVVELGCFYGKATSAMATVCKDGQHIYAVDHFKGTENEKEEFARMAKECVAVYQKTPWEMLEYNCSLFPDVVTVINKDFTEALADFEDKSIDMLFLDGDHMTTYRELSNWWPKVKDTGIVYGHDINQDKFTVREDVERFCLENNLKYSTPHHELFLIRKQRTKKAHAYIITMGHNTRMYAKACLLSVNDCFAHYRDITHVVVDDHSTDGTWERLNEPDLQHPNRILCQPPKRTGSPLASFMFGLSKVQPDDEDVIFWLDGDDWLLDKQAISYMMKPYLRNEATEMAYSQHIVWHGHDKKPTDGFSRPILDPAMVRGDNVRFSHLRSFRYKMLKYVPEEQVKDPATGEYWETCGDSAIYLPMLEVAKRVAFINKPLYLYNCSTGQNEWSSKGDKVSWNSMRLRGMYPNLNSRPDAWPESRFSPVRRFKVDFGRACDIECRGCYYKHQKEKHSLSDDDIMRVLVDGRNRGSRMCDFSGGEPTLYKNRLPGWIRMAKSVGIMPGIITHGQNLAPMLDELWDAGLSDILFSMHGGPETHNWWTQTEDGYNKLWKAVWKCKAEGFKFRTNTVLHQGYKELPAMAKDLARVQPYISNFINFNPYYEWENEDHPFQAKVSDIAPHLKRAIDILTLAGTMVNVRYFPFCVLRGYEKYIVDMPQVMFDPYEWDYSVTPKTTARYHAYGKELASRTRAYTPKCETCAIAGSVCYGANPVYTKEYGDGELQPYAGEAVSDPFHFRRHAEPGQLWTQVGHNFEWVYNRGK